MSDSLLSKDGDGDGLLDDASELSSEDAGLLELTKKVIFSLLNRRDLMFYLLFITRIRDNLT